MLTALRRPKWLATALFVVALAGLFVRLGFWQLDRLEERRASNQEVSERMEAELISYAQLTEPAALEYRRVTVEGAYDPNEEVLIRSQTHRGVAGFHVITPLVYDGGAVLVNRGWVPLTMDSVPVDAAPSSGVVVVEAWVHLTQERPTFGPEDPPGRLTTFNRVDIVRIQEQVSHDLDDVYLVAMGPAGVLPEPADPPDATNDGPHLAYAIQWFAFALIGTVGFGVLMRRNVC